MKKRVRTSKDNSKIFFILITIIIIISLVVDLLSLNVLYSISGSGDLEGELASSSYYVSCEMQCVADLWLSGGTDYEKKRDYNACMRTCCYAECDEKEDKGGTARERRACGAYCGARYPPPYIYGTNK